jgi:ActR/RegA family two-component response regulator
MPDRISLLFVDDEPGIRMTLPAILEMHGFAVTTAATVHEALGIIQRERFEILLSDLNIGDPGDGFTVVSAMRRSQPDCHNFILTGYPDFETALQAIRNQVDDYFVKPANIPALVNCLRERASKRPAPLQAKTVSTLLLEKQDLIISDWIVRVKEDSDLRNLPLTDDERINHAPVLLAELSGCVQRKESCLTVDSIKSAAEHGKIRFQQHYSVPMMVNESRLLENAIADTLQANLLSLDLSSLIADIFIMGNCFNLMLSESVRAFQALADVPTAA